MSPAHAADGPADIQVSYPAICRPAGPRIIATRAPLPTCGDCLSVGRQLSVLECEDCRFCIVRARGERNTRCLAPGRLAGAHAFTRPRPTGHTTLVREEIAMSPQAVHAEQSTTIRDQGSRTAIRPFRVTVP